MPIGRVHFGTRVDRVLASAGFQTLGEVLHYPKEKWVEMSALGTNSLAHLVKEIEVYRQAARATAKAEREKRNRDISKDQLREEAEAMEDFADMLMVTYEHMMRVAKQAEAQDIPLAEGIWQDETIRKAAQNYVLRLLVHEKYEGSSFETLSADFPHRIFDETAFVALLDSMEKQHLEARQALLLCLSFTGNGTPLGLPGAECQGVETSFVGTVAGRGGRASGGDTRTRAPDPEEDFLEAPTRTGRILRFLQAEICRTDG